MTAFVTDTAMVRLRAEIVDRHDLLLIMLFGEDALPPEMVKRLRVKGYTWPATFNPGPVDAFQFGLLAAKFQREGRKVPVTLAEFKKVHASNPTPLGAEERAAIESVRRDLLARIQGLGDKVNTVTGEILTAADKDLRRRLAGTLEREIRGGIARRQTAKEVAIKLRAATKDYATDFMKIAVTEMNNAYQEGRLFSIQRANKGKDPLVFKRPRPDCCPECREAYLVDGTNRPRLFRLSALLAHGTNVGRKHSERKAVLESHHPWCHCVLTELPDGFRLNAAGNMVPRG
jgi:hypothetical protein